MQHEIKVDKKDIVQDKQVDSSGRVTGLSAFKGCRVTVIIHGTTPCQGASKKAHPVTSTPPDGTPEEEDADG